MVTRRSNSQKSLTGRWMPCSWASVQRMSEATAAPRWVWSSASPSSRGTHPSLCSRAMTGITRRELIRRGGRAAAGVAFASQLEWLPGCGSSGKAPTESDWNDLAHRLQGRLVRPGERGYPLLHVPSNLRYADVHPRGIVLCKSPEDVRQSILWARDHGLPTVARAGGHRYSGYSVTPGVLIDLRRMNGVQVSKADGTATV